MKTMRDILWKFFRIEIVSENGRDLYRPIFSDLNSTKPREIANKMHCREASSLSNCFARNIHPCQAKYSQDRLFLVRKAQSFYQGP